MTPTQLRQNIDPTIFVEIICHNLCDHAADCISQMDVPGQTFSWMMRECSLKSGRSYREIDSRHVWGGKNWRMRLFDADALARRFKEKRATSIGSDSNVIASIRLRPNR